LVGTLKKAIRNGRKIQQLLDRAGPELVRKYRKSRTKP
jgi:hypothetical protein